MNPELLNMLVKRVQNSPTERITSTDLTKWTARDVDIDLLHEISLAVARSYQFQSISYQTADDVMNDLWRLFQERFLANATELPSPFWDVFEAFDAGEYHRRPDKSDNPVADHTDPMIAELLTRYPIRPKL
ncbi:MAG: hypothetical protein AB3N24_09965 [Leisingera sp.]